jgi:uncharacterized phage infection (PIP) family protein YhgE
MNYLRSSQLLLNPDSTGGGGGNPPADENNPSDANKGGITAEELHKGIEKARLEERSKLRGELENANNAAKAAKADLSEAQKELAELKQKFEALKTEYSTLKSSIKDGSKNEIDIEAVISKTAAEAQKTLLAEVAELRSQLEQERNLRVSAEAETTRARLVAEAAQKHSVSEALLSELVKGLPVNEELAEAIEAKVELLKKNLPAGNTTDNGNAGGTATTRGIPPSASFRSAAGETLAGVAVNRIKEMSDAEWKEHRAKLLQSVRGRYASSNPMVRS